ncbi:hypothetical protein IA539_23140 [Gordonia sp. zg691]|uniref:hypothetical protein n=1 Tax=Gordonia jinghuaiqii TaxID=2758710 RepID=UPI0016623051|nr:hypothetical protein [Gordonia jinghuaiqii]MBD0864063.1 hypothetical protein [Gordonia jinghuaiqii]
MSADFNAGVDAMLRAASQHRAQQADAIGNRRRTSAAVATEYFRHVVPMGAEAFSVLARRGLPVRSGDPSGHDPRARYIRLSPSGTVKDPGAWARGTFFLTDLRFLHAGGLLIHRDCLRYRSGEAERYRRGGGIGEPPPQPPRGVQPSSDGLFTWYDEAGLRHEFARTYRALSGGPLSDILSPERRPATDNDGFVHVDFDSDTTYVAWQFLDGGASKGTIGDYLADDLRVETLHAYLTRLVAHEVVLQERRVGP